MDVNSVSFNGWYKMSDKQLSQLTPRQSYCLGLSTAKYQKQKSKIDAVDGLYLNVTDNGKNEFLKACAKFGIVPDKIKI